MNLISNEYSNVIQDINLLKKLVFDRGITSSSVRNSYQFSINGEKDLFNCTVDDHINVLDNNNNNRKSIRGF